MLRPLSSPADGTKFSLSLSAISGCFPDQPIKCQPEGRMMNHTTCNLCGQKLLEGSKVRYEVKLEVKAAYDPLNITDEDLTQDFGQEFATALEQLEAMSTEEAQDQVYRLFEFDLCSACQRRYVKNPLLRESLDS
jgi:hypothetical protein